ncbi:disease resistance protein RPP13-like [Arachis duranensis]|uniref:Disease resistance protein RPP13-like n=1 Tax=Arachis duranensis TaxID=130453 RepID=A0A9C6TMH1_ARADU|nr:disease resistance protein RPP13-like [Arachis duranensis]
MADSSDHDSTPLSYFKYDVFLSFRGYTRFEFTDTLYHALINNRIETFRDSEELRIGEELEGALVEAIERSRMSTVILCDEYPTSKWCLDELVKIMECSGNGTKRPVLPVYFRVAKSDVQFQKNKYETAMAAHQVKGRNNHKLEAWKSALSQVGKIYGQRCDHKTPSGLAIDKIVEEVKKRLPPLPLYIGRPLGFDSELEAAKSLLEIDSNATCFTLGIHGDGDEISIFVAELYNKIRPHFVAASVLSNVSEKTNKSGGGLEDLQMTLLSEMGEEVKSKIGSTFKGSSEIKRRLGQKRVLLVLDDVDSTHQLNSLAGGIDWFGPGSRIIITTRYEDVLDDHALNNGVEVRKYCITKGSGSTVKEENVVGLEKDFEIVINQLKEEDSPGNVVSIVGMGGIGKTTLARKIYNSDEVKKLFPCRAWATVSKDYREKEVYKSLLNCLKPSSSKSKLEDLSSKEELKEEVMQCLKGKKYLVVLDDVWDTKAWGTIKDCFTNNSSGGMILLTTRNDQVAYFSRSKDLHHKLSFMDKEESWKLFSLEVFCGENCPLELEPIGRSIAKSCKGLPLAIKTVAGFVLKRERSEDAWKEIMNLLPYCCVTEDKESSEAMKGILKFSYDDLPNKLKPCFLYLGIFPEDDEIRVRDLIHLWMAEGFIEQIQTGRSEEAPPEPEDIGEQYLKELVDRNLVQVAKRRSDGKGVKTCQIHDLIRQLCISESNNRNNNACRFFFPNNIGSYACSVTCNQSCTRSLLIHGDARGWSHHIPKNCRVNVLYLAKWWVIATVTEKEYLKTLKHLRYLRMDYFDGYNKFPSVETLHISQYFLKEFSIGGWKQLRHLHCELCMNLLVDEKQGVKDKMQHVQTLCYVYADSHLEFLLDNGYFPNLRTLGLVIIEDPYSFSEPVEENLRSLHRLNNLRFQNLESIDMKILGRIPRLEVLKLEDVNCMEILDCGSDRSFPRLQVFMMIHVIVERLTLEDGAMPCLRRAVFHKCPGLELKNLPEQMSSLGCNLEYVQCEDSYQMTDDVYFDDDDDYKLDLDLDLINVIDKYAI